MNIIFLYYDGVVNTKLWDLTGEVCRFNLPEDGANNNYQSVQWVSEFCENYEYSIVVTSTWNNYDSKRSNMIKICAATFNVTNVFKIYVNGSYDAFCKLVCNR